MNSHKKQLETSLEIKTQQKEELDHKLSLLDDNRVLLGGFLQTKNIFAFTDPETFSHTNDLMQELREKEQEIYEITTNLKISQALEQAERSESARRAEEQARLSSEEKGIIAIKQAKMATEQARFAEERAYLSEKQNLKLEEMIASLKEQLKIHEHEITLANQRLENGDVLASEMHQLQDSYDALINEHAQLKAGLQDAYDLRAKLMQAKETLVQVENALAQEKTHSQAQENEIMSLNETLSTMKKDKQQAEFLLTQAVERMNVMALVLNTERNLRALYEEKSKEAQAFAFTMDMKCQAEEYARKMAEQKNQTYHRTSRPYRAAAA